MLKIKKWSHFAILRLIAVLAIAAHVPGSALADTGGAGETIILTIETGAASGQDVRKHTFSLAALEKLPLAKVTTRTPWTKSVTTFEGVLLRDVLTESKMSGSQLRAVALNDYGANISASDAVKYDVILAYKVDGKIIGIREKGPLWIIYPMDQNAELQTEAVYARSVWQLTKIIVTP